MKKHKALKIVLIILAVVLVGGGIGGYFYVKGKLDKIGKFDDEDNAYRERVFEEDDSDARTYADFVVPEEDIKLPDPGKIVSDKDIINILLIGSDARVVGRNSRSDTMIVCSINKKTGDIKLVSFMRDTYVKVAGSEGRLNTAYFYGGKTLLDATLQRNFGVVVDANVAVNFESFIAAFAQIGNIEIELTKEEADYLNKTSWNKWNFKAGKASLNPEQVLAYCRARHLSGSDWSRTDRQRKVLMAGFEKAKTLSISQLIDLADRILPNVATDMSSKQIFDLVRFVFTNNMKISGQLRIPVDGKGTNVNGASVLTCNLTKNANEFKKFIYGK